MTPRPALPFWAMMCEMGGKRDGGPKAVGVPSPKLFTIGYQALTPAELVKRLKTAGVERVIDVRELPLSRRRGFSKSSLAATLEGAGIRYEHVRALGNPKPTRDRYKSGDVEGGARDYRAHLHNGSHAALVELAESAPLPGLALTGSWLGLPGSPGGA